MADLAAVLSQADSNLNSSLDRLSDLVRIKSISTDPAFAAECRKAAQWLVDSLTELGFSASVRDTEGHPMVVAHHDGPDGAPHVLFYGHYDVQPVDPLELWTSDPFDPGIKELSPGRKVITGRGTSDDKGQLLTFVEACRAYKETQGDLPCRVTILFEGEEESGSKSLKPFLDANAEELKADLAMVCDTGMWNAETPSISVSLRGLTGEEITIKAASRDLHSGHYGGNAANPIHILSKILGDIHDENGWVTIPHFYDGVHETPDNIKSMWEGLGAPENFLSAVGLSVPSGESDRTILERAWARPTAEVNGITGGYSGEGFKTVIAAQASAKVSFRLVGDQDPHAVRSNFREFVKARIPADCSVDFEEHGTSGAIHLPFDSPALAKAVAVLEEEWGNPAAIIGMGGSIPIVGDFQSKLGMESLLVGFALEDDCIHSPNEKYDLRSFHMGIRSWVRIMDALAR
ncbi:MAG: M20/M25/M40 family metallo-hydrolase [Hyphomicrobiales bacterium]|nr:M20/M25/M40 family metallo-hydrolase [Hyphomicrobiales bacterium]MCP5002038.1 M20/M25/M40 family metallo-hydrolase [Hyphomicrobiales bacterium]